jgi:hypothetical protein
MNHLWQHRFISSGFFGALQFLILTTIAIFLYPGGTIHEPHLQHYSFFYNFFSDLGRTHTFEGASNEVCHLIFKITLTISGICIILFFIALPGLFKDEISKSLAIITMVFGVLAGLSYIGIGNAPWNVDYWGHRFYVRVGFLAFLAMTLFYTLAIYYEKAYHNRYAFAMAVFAFVLLVQIIIMFCASNAWHSNEALFFQAVAQKVVVYAEIICMLYQSIGAIKISYLKNNIK